MQKRELSVYMYFSGQHWRHSPVKLMLRPEINRFIMFMESPFTDVFFFGGGWGDQGFSVIEEILVIWQNRP